MFKTVDLESFRSAVHGARVLVSTHVHPDPDAIGSALAASDMLIALGAQPKIVLEDSVPSRMTWLPGAERIALYEAGETLPTFPVAMIVDSAGLSRIGDVITLLGPEVTIANIDHHVSNQHFGSLNWVEVSCAATAEILFELCHALHIPLTPEIATNLYAGLLTDTGRFRYSNTNARTFQVAAELAHSGAALTEITNRLYYDVSAQDVRSMGSIFDTLQLHGDHQVSLLIVRKEDIVEDPDTVVDMALSIKGVELAVLLTEAPVDRIRISLRSRNRVNVSTIAERFGGGGHERAAGFRMRGTIETVRERVLPVLLEAVAVRKMEQTAQEV
jgi:phosphoesterase RecJ-like protein